MAINKEDKFGQSMLLWIEKGIKEEVDAAWEKHKKDMIEQIDRDKSRAVASILLYVMKQVEINTMEEKITFTIKSQESH